MTYGNGYTSRDRRAEGSLSFTPLSLVGRRRAAWVASVTLVPLLWTGVPTSARQEPADLWLPRLGRLAVCLSPDRLFLAANFRGTNGARA